VSVKFEKLTAPAVRFDSDDWRAAVLAFGIVNCGPAALAAMLGVKPLDVLPHIPNFRERHYTSPSMMAAALRSLGVRWTEQAAPTRGLAGEYALLRIQWEGPWTKPGANPKWAYRQTHWIGVACFRRRVPGDDACVFDVNQGWSDVGYWERETVPKLIALYPRASGGWHVTHRWELN
jgi:hypothetical protein